ncbi:MAG: GDP-L-fucose synthase [Gemmataceae bacterium]
MKQTSRIYVAGGTTLLGRALIRRLQARGFANLVGLPGDEPDLTVRGQVEDFFGEARPEYVFVAAGLSGGIGLNRSRPATLMLDNLLVAAHVLEAAQAHGVTKLVYLASSCSYPRDAAQPLAVESLMSGPLEPTNAAYATAKLAGWQLARAYRQEYGARFITAIPANGFGPDDDFDPASGHVIPALLRRCHEAKVQRQPSVTIWGTGTPRREFVYADDLADACLFVMDRYDGEAPINLGGGESLSIAGVARAVAGVVGYEGELRFDPSMPDGMPLKMLDARPLRALGWSPATEFRTALAQTYAWYLQHEKSREDDTDVRTAVSSAVSDSADRGRGRPGVSD